MKSIIPESPAIYRNDFASIQEIFAKNVVPTYARFDLAFTHGKGSFLWDVTGKRYLDLGGGIAVCSLGHAHPAITEALVEQSQKLVHVSNLYYTEPQGRLAQAYAEKIGAGRLFFCNSGAEANEALLKVARKFGHAEGRFEVITATNSFHGRTLGGIAATGQAKIKNGFEPMIPGFRHVPYNDLRAVEDAISPATAAILIEGIQGESGITPATPEFLLGLRKLCDDKRLLLLYDAVQCGFFRTGCFQSYQRILEQTEWAGRFLPDAISMAKSVAGGLPMGAVWIRNAHSELLGPGSHGTTFGGTPLVCAVALKVWETVQKERLDENARKVGAYLKDGLERLGQKYPNVFDTVRGLGLMIGIQLKPEIPKLKHETKSHAVQFVNRLHAAGVLTIPAGSHVVRLLPALNLSTAEADEGLQVFDSVLESIS